MSVFRGPLGARKAPDDRHIAKYALTAETMPETPKPGIAGMDWPDRFDEPVEKTGPNGRVEYWVDVKPGQEGSIRGGHAICPPADPKRDRRSWYLHYEQPAEGICAGEAACRAQTHLNRVKYDPALLYDWAIKNDGLADTNGRQDGTTVRAVCEGLMKVGPHVVRAGTSTGPKPEHGIAAFRWATTIEQFLAALGNPLYAQRGAAPFHNSWGEGYPQVTWMSLELWAHMLFGRDFGEVAFLIDKPGPERGSTS